MFLNLRIQQCPVSPRKDWSYFFVAGGRVNPHRLHLGLLKVYLSPSNNVPKIYTLTLSKLAFVWQSYLAQSGKDLTDVLKMLIPAIPVNDTIIHVGG